ncbi:PilC/PilY family type IV pilus protein [Desulfoluna sp.]|uniref:PilC/PilY family type IV pilus protein n=1 Tax=Desulfoluna sp. TaxID=2045199 RepID=UPI002622EC40|nr:PilC/PilY family type IV pilus protein [Desulfoluna sp.]
MKFRFGVLLFLLVLVCSSNAMADDVEIYGTQPVTVEPNVLIIFDTSGSMDWGVYPYTAGTTYSGTYPADAVYYRQWDGVIWGFWNKYRNSVSYMSYSYQQILITNGCTGSNRTPQYATGDYLNYRSTAKKRMAVAQKAVTDLIGETTGVRFGLMKLNGTDGGKLISGCGESNDLSSKVNALIAGGATPLAEALAEAGLYFAGRKGHFTHQYSKYKSPIENRCQKNYVILFTDGVPTTDEDSILYEKDGYMGQTLGDFDKDKKDLTTSGKVKRYATPDAGSQLSQVDNGTTHFLDDVAQFLYKKDIRPDMGTNTTFKKQNIITHTIGFTLENDLLKSTAKNGGGTYYTASNASELKDAFKKIMSSISEESTTFVAPVVPVNRGNRTSGGKYIYLAFFKPVQSGDWKGNLKKYKLSESGDILDAFDNAAANEDGSMKENSYSCWSALESDGADVLKGGAGSVIKKQDDRKFLTYTYTAGHKNLTDTANLFEKSNTHLIDRGVTSEQIDLVKKNGAEDWPIGSIIHSEPVVVHYSPSSSVIYFGSNDGLFRAIDDATGKELWAFVPPGQHERLAFLDDSDYDYYVDGPLSVSYGAFDWGDKLFKPDTVLVGERRGGERYYALDISSKSEPKWKFEVTTAGGEKLGQTWGKPASCRVKLSADSEAKVFILPGGYDSEQDNNDPRPVSDGVGRALFAVKASDGALAGLNINHGNFPKMTHSIVDLYPVDADADGITTRVYAGDMGGHVFVVADDLLVTEKDGTRLVQEKVPDGNWSYKNRLFSCYPLKLFYAPVPADVAGIETLYFGTGNRAAPMAHEANRFYAVKNNFLDSDLTENDLVDVRDESVSYTDVLKTKKGWYFSFSHANEKVVSTANVSSGVVYFTTYTPSPETVISQGSDPCAGAETRGVGRLYAVSAKDGKAVSTWGKASKSRFTELPSGLPMGKAIINGDKIQTWPVNWDVAKDDRVNYFYWKQRP